MFGFGTPEAQAKVPSLQGRGGLYLAGAWCGYGFHEDGINSAIAAVKAMGAAVPWVPRATSPKIGWLDSAACSLFNRFARAAITRGRLRIVLPNGAELVYGSLPSAPSAAAEVDAWKGKPPLEAIVTLYDASFFRKVISRHDTGLGESYMDGDYEVSGDLGRLLAVATANAVDIEDTRGLLGFFNRLGDRALAAAHAARSNTAAGSRRNIEEHYDAGNAMYKLFLDESMTYSCGIWTGPGKRFLFPLSFLIRSSNGFSCSVLLKCIINDPQSFTLSKQNNADCDLHRSQLNKLDALIDKAGITADHHVLEIGCGWGSFAMRAASRTGCRVTGLTISKEQLAEATDRVKAAGLADKITLLFCDYRDCPGAGTYDRVVSCEMIEAVGHEHLGAYFITIGAMLKP
jgi:cyclopropane-fatty-acyl-phospholipid synthase